MRLDPSLKNKEDFLNLFYKPPCIDSFPITKKTKVSLYTLKITNSSFDYESLYKVLGNASITYVLSRLRYDQFYKNQKIWEQVREATSKFREWGVNEGEGGELILYCFLESHLNAPKILSKMELKTNPNNYVKGFDGVHLLELEPKKFQLIYGESKMIANLKDGIYQSIQSLGKLKKRGFSEEVSLIDSNLMKESYSKSTLKYLKDIIIPQRSRTLDRDNAFGIFLGFEIDINDWDIQNMSNDQFIKALKNKIKKDFEAQLSYIKERIELESLEGHHFYFYAVPFLKRKKMDLKQIREKIIKRVTGS